MTFNQPHGKVRPLRDDPQSRALLESLRVLSCRTFANCQLLLIGLWFALSQAFCCWTEMGWISMESSSARIRDAAAVGEGVPVRPSRRRLNRTRAAVSARSDAGRSLAHHHVVAAYLTAVAAVVTAGGTILSEPFRSLDQSRGGSAPLTVPGPGLMNARVVRVRPTSTPVAVALGGAWCRVQ